jgi:uncharacterized damage-inducible protein DinB
VSDLAGHFRAMARNNAWSNHRLHAACARLSEADYRARRTSFFPSLHLTLNHILLVDWYYLDALEGGGRGLELSGLGDEPCGTLAEVTAAQRAADRRLVAYCDGLDGEGGLGATAVLLRPGGRRYEERAADVLAHLFVHQIHHRGQAHAMLSGTEVAPPQLDEFFLAQDAPLRADELRELRALGL